MPENKYKNIDTKKLKFKPDWNEAGKIQVRADNGRLYDMTREKILVSIKHGFHFDKISTFFTSESISQALKVASEKPKKDESKDSK